MPNEHFYRPAEHGDWVKYHEASRGALEGGELADRWLREHPELGPELGRAKYEELARSSGSSDEIQRFEDWRTAVSDAIVSASTVAAVEAGEFVTIAAKEAKRNRVPEFREPNDPQSPDRDVTRTYTDLSTVGKSELVRELQVAGMKIDDPGFQSVQDDAKAQVTRSVGGLRSVVDAFGAACAKAVGDFHGESTGGPAWEGSYVKNRCEGLSLTLERWDKLLQSTAPPPSREQLHGLAGVCHSALRQLAAECVPGSKAGDVAFVRITGLAIVWALGEKIAAQLASRVGVPTFQGMHDRIGEIPVRGTVEAKVAQEYKKGSDKLSDVWKDRLERFQKRLTKVDPHFAINFKTAVGDVKAMTNLLTTWNTNFKKPGATGAGAALQGCVGSLALELSRIRKIVEAPLAPSEETHDKAKEISEARAFMLDSIDGLVRKIQSDIQIGVTSGNDDLG